MKLFKVFVVVLFTTVLLGTPDDTFDHMVEIGFEEMSYPAIDIGSFHPSTYHVLQTYASGHQEIITLSYEHFQTEQLLNLHIPGIHSLNVITGYHHLILNIQVKSPLIPTIMESLYQRGLEEEGIDIPYEEWLLTIKGDPGRSIVNAHVDEEGILHLTFCDGEIKPLMTVTGEKGDDGISIELDIINQHLQWRNLEGEWNPLIPLSQLTGLRGLRGFTGAPGESIELRVHDGFLQSSYPSSPSWENILDLNTLKSEAGRSISDASINVYGDFSITYSDGSTHIAGSFEKSHMVIVVGHHGEVLDFSSVRSGERARSVTPPSINGQTFISWSGPFAPIDKDTIIKALYQKNQVTVSFESNGGTSFEDITLDFDSTLDLPTPEKEGFEFKGWFYGESIHDQQLTHQTAILENITVFARWDVEIYNVIYAMEGSILQQTYTLYNQAVFPPDNPTKVGFEFIGWNQTSSAVQSDLWIEPVFEALSFGISYISLPCDYDPNTGVLLNQDEDIIKIAAGQFHSGALTNKGDLYLWGRNDYGQLGTQDTIDLLIPKLINSHLNLTSNEHIIDFDLGSNHSIILTSTNRVLTFGLNSKGQLGKGDLTSSNIAVDITDEFQLNPNEKILYVYAKADRTSALSDTDRLFIWGDNTYGMIGDGTTIARRVPTDVTEYFNLEAGDRIIEIHLSHTFSAAISEMNKVFVWGSNTIGQLGDGTTTNSSTPKLLNSIPLDDEDYINKISLGNEHILVTTHHHKIFSWGYNLNGQLGNKTSSYSANSAPIDISLNFDTNIAIETIDIYAGVRISFVVFNQSFVYGFGDNGKRIISNENINNISTPLNVTDERVENTEIKSLILTSSSSDPFALSLDKNHNIISWGSNVYGQLGDNTTTLGTYPTHTHLFTQRVLEESTYVYGEDLDLLEPTLTGYTFAGWYEDMALTIPFEETTMPEEDITLYAKWALE